MADTEDMMFKGWLTFWGVAVASGIGFGIFKLVTTPAWMYLLEGLSWLMIIIGTPVFVIWLCGIIATDGVFLVTKFVHRRRCKATKWSECYANDSAYNSGDERIPSKRELYHPKFWISYERKLDAFRTKLKETLDKAHKKHDDPYYHCWDCNRIREKEQFEE